MKRILFLFLMILIFGCRTIEYIEVPVPIEIELDESQLPLRTELPAREEGETLAKFMLRRILYYSNLVKEWESYGIYVYDTLDKPLPESLQSVQIQ